MSGKKLALSDSDKKIAGVCGGIAEYFGIDSTLVRIIAVIFILAGGAGILLYIVGWILMPHMSDSYRQ